MVTIVKSENKDMNYLIPYYEKALLDQKILSETIEPQSHIMAQFKISRLPAAIFSNGRVVYLKDMKDYIIKTGSAPAEML